MSAAAADGPRRKSLNVKRNVNIGEQKTSVILEDAFWDAFKEIAAAHGTTVSRLIAALDNERRERLQSNLSSAVRQFVLDYYRSRCRPERSMS